MSTKPGVVVALLLTGLLSAGVCAPVGAQVTSPPASVAPAGAAVPWNSLSQDQQRLLSRLSGQWEQLTPQRQQALASGSQRWLGMSPVQRTQARQRFGKFQQLPQQRRQQLRQRWQNATPAQRQNMVQRARQRRAERVERAPKLR